MDMVDSGLGFFQVPYHPKQTLQRLQILNLGGYILKVIYHSIAYSTRQKVFVPPAVSVGLLWIYNVTILIIEYDQMEGVSAGINAPWLTEWSVRNGGTLRESSVWLRRPPYKNECLMHVLCTLTLLQGSHGGSGSDAHLSHPPHIAAHHIHEYQVDIQWFSMLLGGFCKTGK